MTKKMLFTFLLLLSIGAMAAWLPGNVIWEESFPDRESLSAWKSTGAPPEWIPGGGPGGRCAAVRFSCGKFGNRHIEKELNLSTFQGTILIEGWIKAENVQGMASYLGPKLMLVSTEVGRLRYFEPEKGFGTYDWKFVRQYITLGKDLEKLSLMLGLQNGKGTFLLADLKIRKGREVSAEEADRVLRLERKVDRSIPLGAYRKTEKTRFRGVMSGDDLSSEAFTELEKWNVNLMRYQMFPKKEIREKIRTPEDFQSWIDSEIEFISTKLLPLAEKHRIKVVLDLHFGGRKVTHLLSNELSVNGEADSSMLEKAWHKLASRFRGNPNIYGYDLLNEPKPADPANNPWPEIAQKLVDSIRNVDPETPIIIEWFLVPPFLVKGKGIIYSPHFYPPMEYTHQEISAYRSRYAYPGSIGGKYWDKESLREALKEVILFQRKHRIPIYVGEFSVAAWAEGGAQYLDDLISLFEEYGWDWTYHAFREFPGWSVEHSGNSRRNLKKVPDSDRKQVLLKFLKKNTEFMYFEGSTDRNPLSYKRGETIVFTIYHTNAGKPTRGIPLKWERTGDDGVKTEGSAISDPDQPLVIRTSTAIPGFVRIRVLALNSKGIPLPGEGNIFDGGAGAETASLNSSLPPHDFETFWKKQLAKSAMIPSAPTLIPIKSAEKGILVYEFKLPSASARPATGYLCMPENVKPKTLPALMLFDGYSVKSAEIPYLAAKKGVLVMYVSLHGLENGRESAYYRKFADGELRGFAFQNNEDPEKSYLNDVIMRDLKALEYLKSRPEWNGRDLTLSAGSMGAFQAITLSAWDPSVTFCNVWIPWLADLRGMAYGRLRGWRPDSAKGLDYYDIIHQAPRIRCRVALQFGLGDYVCPPSGELVFYNRLTCEKSFEAIQNRRHGYCQPNAKSYRDFNP